MASNTWTSSRRALISWSIPSTIADVFEYKMFLCDFSISHIFEDEGISQTSEYFGRASKFAAPESASDQSHGRAADIFSLDCVLAEITQWDESRLTRSKRSSFYQAVQRDN
jgi:hypothetical protein